ncbi:MAG: hypothetical protein ACYCXN_11925 [Acidimicrobiales bacterium]
MTTLRSDEVRIPREAREAVARHEKVIVLNRERPVFAIVHADDLGAAALKRRPGRLVSEIAADLAGAPAPDPFFAEDMGAVLRSVAPVTEVPWEP